MTNPALRLLGSAIGDFGNADRPISASELAEGDYPPATFLIHGILPENLPTLLYADGGIGKTTLSENMAVSIAAGLPFLGFKTKKAPVLLVLAEDDYGETKRRLLAICAARSIRLSDLPIHIWARPGRDSVIANVGDDGSYQDLPFAASLRAELAKHRGCFLVLDSLSDIAIFDEIKRLAVNALCKRLLGGLCRDFGCTILVLGHPSKSAMEDGRLYSGSTAFNNAVRQRLTLEKPPTHDPECTTRIFKVAKSNYAPTLELPLILEDSVFHLASAATQVRRTEDERRQLFLLVKELLEQGQRIVRSNGNGLGPKDLANAYAQRFGKRLPVPVIREHLGALMVSRKLQYEPADNSKRGVVSGYRIGPNG